MSGNWGMRSSGGGGRCALYSLYISVRNVFSDLSKITARWVGRSSGFISLSSFHSMAQKPYTALTCVPSAVRGSNLIAWYARKMKPEPSTRNTWSPFLTARDAAFGGAGTAVFVLGLDFAEAGMCGMWARSG